ncbi:GLPGLI family protein [Flavobacterium sp. LC2016-12]|uniref:GLPGLI family protein n=1 Tax=Flavobacterium sp. LC2016-12 TaxID=2783794 RepID=UPI001889ECDC|nr:GLPGLI family protein [Flavobacterium sp. LC2016-12]MBF4464548.1 GLPGLI family protein [Flavobacterium sp. LC2016-12]
MSSNQQEFTKTILILLLFQHLCFSQNSNKGIVYYGQIESSYFGSKNGKERLATLVFNKKESSYVSQKDSLDALMNNFPNRQGGTTLYTAGLPATENGSQVFTSLQKDSVWSSFLKNGFQYVAEKKILFKWDLQNETKKIGRFTCNKAITQFRGREYIAWYTNEIPLPYGPWKLQGLPGLILEAYDSSQEINYYFKSIEYPTTNKTPIDFIKSTDKKTINWMDRKGYIKFCNDHLQRVYERMLMADKEVPTSSPSEKGTIEQNFKEITE